MTDTCSTIKLSEVVDLFLTENSVEKKKYFQSYMISAKYVWKDIFKNTIYSVRNEWLTLQKGTPYNFINIPTGTVRIFGVNDVDDCGNIQPLYYNNLLNILKKPVIKKCGCGCDSCAGMCNDVNSFTRTTKLLFTINETEYFEVTYLQYCPNGDIIEFKEVPTKKYLNRTGGSGDFNNSFNDDYSILAAPFDDYEIVTETFQRKICKLETLECGCAADTPENIETLTQCCNGFLDICCNARRKKCDLPTFQNANNNFRGEVKFGDCGTKIYFRPSRHWKAATDKKIPDFLLLSFQGSGEVPGIEVEVPEDALDSMYAGLHWRRIRHKDNYALVQKNDAKYQYEDAKNKYLLFRNPLSLEQLGNIQDSFIKW